MKFVYILLAIVPLVLISTVAAMEPLQLSHPTTAEENNRSTAERNLKAVSDNSGLVPNQTVSDAAANMTHALYGERSGIACPGVSLANVQIKPTICLFEVTARCPSTVSGAVAPLYAKYLKQHPDYMGILAVNVYVQDKTLVMTTTVSNEDARANYDGISYLMEKNADYLQYPSKRTDGLETPLGIVGELAGLS